MYIYIVCFIKLTSSYKSQKFVSLIDAPYFKNAFAPGASIRRNTVIKKFKDTKGVIISHQLKDRQCNIKFC